MKRPLFETGRVCGTLGALRRIPFEVCCSSLRRHISGDWGDLSAEDVSANVEALECGLRLFSSYDASTVSVIDAITGLEVEANVPKHWIITEADRSVTTILLPTEY